MLSKELVSQLKMTYEAAEKLFKRDTVSKTAFQVFPIAILARLCGTYGLPVRATGKKPMGSIKKSDYVDAIFSAVRLTYMKATNILTTFMYSDSDLKLPQFPTPKMNRGATQVQCQSTPTLTSTARTAIPSQIPKPVEWRLTWSVL